MSGSSPPADPPWMALPRPRDAGAPAAVAPGTVTYTGSRLSRWYWRQVIACLFVIVHGYVNDVRVTRG